MKEKKCAGGCRIVDDPVTAVDHHSRQGEAGEDSPSTARCGLATRAHLVGLLLDRPRRLALKRAARKTSSSVKALTTLMPCSVSCNVLQDADPAGELGLGDAADAL